MKRLLQVMSGAPVGGAETFFVRLVGALHRAGMPQRVVIRRDPARAAAIRAEGPEPAELAFGGRWDFLTRRRIAAIAADFEPDVALTWMNRASGMTPPGPYVKIARLGGYYNLRYYRDCEHLVGNTAAICDYIRSHGWPASRVHHLPNFVPAPSAPPLPRSALHTPAGVPLLLAMGRLHRNKAYDVLLQALARLGDTHLWLAGEGPEAAALKALAGSLGIADRVRFIGWRQDGDALRAAADVLVCPSRFEPLGNVVLEAWAARLPVVAAAAAGPAALIRDGENGLLVPPDDAAALATSLARLTADAGLRARLVEAGEADWRAGFTEQAVVARYLALFDKVCR